MQVLTQVAKVTWADLLDRGYIVGVTGCPQRCCPFPTAKGTWGRERPALTSISLFLESGTLGTLVQGMEEQLQRTEKFLSLPPSQLQAHMCFQERLCLVLPLNQFLPQNYPVSSSLRIAISVTHLLWMSGTIWKCHFVSWLSISLGIMSSNSIGLGPTSQCQGLKS